MRKTGLMLILLGAVLSAAGCAPLLIGGAGAVVADEVIEQDQGGESPQGKKLRHQTSTFPGSIRNSTFRATNSSGARSISGLFGRVYAARAQNFGVHSGN